MTVAACLAPGETLGDRVMKVDHAGEHGAVCVYRAQRWMARWRAPDLIAEMARSLRTNAAIAPRLALNWRGAGAGAAAASCCAGPAGSYSVR